MARTPLLNLRVDDETKARWEVAAREAGYSLAEYVREAVEERVSVDASAKKPSRSRKTAPKEKLLTGRVVEKGSSSHSRTGMCEHRIPATAHCVKCD